MVNNKERYDRERETRWGMAKKGEPLAIEALVRGLNTRVRNNILPIRFDDIWFEKYNPKEIEWVKGCSDYYLDITTEQNNHLYMYIEVKIKRKRFDGTINGKILRSGQVISNYGCESFYLDINPVHRNMNDFCKIANIDKNSFVIMFTDEQFNSIRLISLAEVNYLIDNGWNGATISEFGQGYGEISYLIPVDATHRVEDLTVEQIRNYTSSIFHDGLDEEYKDELQEILQIEFEQEQKELAEERYGTKQYSQDEIEQLFKECLEDISKEVNSRLDVEFGTDRLELNTYDINNNFLGTVLKLKVNKNIIDIKVKYNIISDEPGDISSVDLLLCINGSQIYYKPIEHINGKYIDGDLIQDEFLFTEKHVESFVERVIHLVNAII